MKNKLLYTTSFIVLLMISACSKVLDYSPKGVLSSADLTSPAAIEGLVTSAYSAIGNGDMIGPIYSNWAYGSVRSDDAYKGGGGTGDVWEIEAMEKYNLVTPSMGAFVSRSWQNLYKSISRANVALRAVNSLSDAQYANKKVRIAELRFLRAHSYFKNGLLNGECLLYYNNGCLHILCYYKNDNLYGRHIEYYESNNNTIGCIKKITNKN